MFLEADEAGYVDVDDVVRSAHVDKDVDACARHDPRQVHGRPSLDRGLTSPNHHEKVVVNVNVIVDVVVVVDGRDVEQMLALVAA